MKITINSFPKETTQDGEKYTRWKAWTYRNIDGSPCFYKVRYNSSTLSSKGKCKKCFRQFHEENGKLIMKQPAIEKLPPLKADILSKNEKTDFLLVEGEKCATCQTAINIENAGYIVSTIEGSDLDKTDLSFFKISGTRNGYYLPDNDEPGYKKAYEIKSRIKNIKILRPFPNWKEGESIDDYEIDGMEFNNYIETCEYMTSNELKILAKIKEESAVGMQPFSFLGFDEKSYWFLPDKQDLPLRVMRGDVSLKNYLTELAPDSWWMDNFSKDTKDRGETLDDKKALSFLRENSTRKGLYDSTKLLGVGPHKDEDGNIVINTGKDLILYGGDRIPYNKYFGDLIFTRSRYRFEISGDEWGQEECKCLLEQVSTFGFETQLQRACLIGWCVTAPFASIFDFRPHIWITARKGTGKSHLMENIIEPAVGPFLTKIEGRTTEAGIRQIIGRDSRPVLIDEFEANNKSEQTTLTGILGLARSAYGGGNIVKGSPSHEAVVFETKMTFCFASVKTYITNAADESRIVVINMKESPGRMTGTPPFDGLRKMIYGRLHDLLLNIKLAKKEILKRGNSERAGDTYAPLISGYWMIISDKLFMQDDEIKNMTVGKMLDLISFEKTPEDEDALMNYLLASQQHIIEDQTTQTIAEMLMTYDPETQLLRYDKQLRQIGIRRTWKNINGENKEIIAVSQNSQAIQNILKDTAFFEYKNILPRHKAFIDDGKDKFPPIFMAGKKERVIMLDFEMIKKQYLTDTDIDKKSDNREDIPF